MINIFKSHYNAKLLLKIASVSLVGIFLFSGCQTKIKDEWKIVWGEQNNNASFAKINFANSSIYHFCRQNKQEQVFKQDSYTDILFSIYTGKHLKYAQNEAILICMKQIMTDYTPFEIYIMFANGNREKYKLTKYLENK